MIRVVCLTCRAESWSGGPMAEQTARTFEADHRAAGHRTTRKQIRTRRQQR